MFNALGCYDGPAYESFRFMLGIDKPVEQPPVLGPDTIFQQPHTFLREKQRGLDNVVINHLMFGVRQRFQANHGFLLVDEHHPANVQRLTCEVLDHSGPNTVVVNVLEYSFRRDYKGVGDYEECLISKNYDSANKRYDSYRARGLWRLTGQHFDPNAVMCSIIPDVDPDTGSYFDLQSRWQFAINGSVSNFSLEELLVDVDPSFFNTDLDGKVLVKGDLVQLSYNPLSSVKLGTEQHCGVHKDLSCKWEHDLQKNGSIFMVKRNMAGLKLAVVEQVISGDQIIFTYVGPQYTDVIKVDHNILRPGSLKPKDNRVEHITYTTSLNGSALCEVKFQWV